MCMRLQNRHCIYISVWINSLRPRPNRRHFADDIFKCIFVNENARISIKISLKFVPKGPINNIPTLVQIMAWRRSGDKPLSGPMMVNLPTHICVTRPQWVKNSMILKVLLLRYVIDITMTMITFPVQTVACSGLKALLVYVVIKGMFPTVCEFYLRTVGELITKGCHTRNKLRVLLQLIVATPIA